MSDCVSRQAVKDILNKNQMPYHVYPYLWDELNKLPPAQPERIKGRWENKGKIRAWDVYGIETFGVKRKCTNCGFVHIFIEDHGHYPYCPLCRADME